MRLARFVTALVRHRDVHYARRLLGRAGDNVRLVFGALGAAYVRVRPNEVFGGIPGGDCERWSLAEQPAGFVRLSLVPYHLVLADVAGKTVVDAGTAEGWGAALFARHARTVLAFDASDAAIAVARARYPLPNLRFEVHDATQSFPLAPRSADVVFASEVIEHLHDGAAFVRAAADALADDGLLVVKTPNDAYNRYENRLNPHHVNPYTASRLRAELAARFATVEIQGLTYAQRLDSVVEERPAAGAPELLPWHPGEPIVIDRVLVTRLVVTPERVDPPHGVPEFLLARARRPRR